MEVKKKGKRNFGYQFTYLSILFINQEKYIWLSIWFYEPFGLNKTSTNRVDKIWFGSV